MKRRMQPPIGARLLPVHRMTCLALLLMLLAGCAGVQPGSVPVSDDSPSPATAEAVVAPLPDGREGFLIQETATLEPQVRADFDRAAALLREGDRLQAIALLEAVVAQSPGVSAPHINLAIAYQREGQSEEAEAQLKQALALVPGHPVASNAYGLLCRAQGRFEEARTIYEQSLAAFPGYPPICRNLGILCELYLNDLDAALVQYEAYSRAVPEDEQVKLWVADVRARLGL